MVEDLVGQASLFLLLVEAKVLIGLLLVASLGNLNFGILGHRAQYTIVTTVTTNQSNQF